MKTSAILLSIAMLAAAPALAQTRLNSVNGPGPQFIAPFNNPAATNNGTFYPGYVNPYVNPYVNNGFGNPYGYNNPYVNPYAARGYYPGAYPVPVPVNNGLYRFGIGGMNVNMWRAPSGYYYPWAGVPSGYNSTTILYAQQANTAPTPAQPPISTVVRDMLKYLDESKDKGRLSDADYQHLKRRVGDLQSKEDLMMTQGGNSMDPQDEQSIRNDLDQIGREITTRVSRD